MPRPTIVKNGSVRRAIQLIDEQQQNAHHHRAKQPDAARALLLGLGQLAERIEMKMTLSTPEDDLEDRQGDERDDQLGHREVPRRICTSSAAAAGVLEVLESQAVPPAGEREVVLLRAVDRPVLEHQLVVQPHATPSSLVIDRS